MHIHGWVIEKMTTFVKRKVGQLGFVDALAIAGVKIFEERMLMSWIGNGTLKSGAIKGVGALALDMFLPAGKIKSIVTTALVIDSAEDIINELLGGKLGGMLNGNKESEMTMVV